MNNIQMQRAIVNRALRDIFTGKSPEDTTKIFMETINSQGDTNKTLREINDIWAYAMTSESRRNDVAALYDAGFSFPHIAILARAPKNPTLAQYTATETEILDEWNKEGKFKPKKESIEFKWREAGISVFALAAAIGAVATTGLTLAGTITADETLIKVANMLASYIPGPANEIQAIIETQNKKNLWDLSLPLAGTALAIGLALRDARRDLKKVDLRKVIVSTSATNDQKQRAIRAAGMIKPNLKHLLTHLIGEELVLFLNSDEQERRKLLEIRPPDIRQRVQAARTSNGSTWERMIRVYSERISAWKAPGTLNQPAEQKP